jgi:[acyl-carrier-protein] S-malonyltransferase
LNKKNQKIAFLFPGQGAQYPGMGKDFYESFPIARECFQEADELLSTHFSRLIFEGPEGELTLTKNSQMAIYITSCAILRTLEEQFPHIVPTVCAGLSLGEYTALFASGRISFAGGLSLVQSRGQYMNEACQKTQGTMRVVLGMDEQAITQLLPSYVWVANVNCPGQVVIAGLVSEMSKAEEILKASGAKRVLPLDVSGAFHTPLMQAAQERLKSQLLEAHLLDSKIDFVMNVPGSYVHDHTQIRNYLIEQIVSPTRWKAGIEAMIQKGIEVYFEIGPGKALTGMNKKIGSAGVSLNIEKIADLDNPLLGELYAVIEG